MRRSKMKKKEWLVKITFTEPQDKDYISNLEESDDIEKVEVIKE